MPTLSHHHAPLTQLFKIPSRPIYSSEVSLSQTSSISTLQVRALCPVSLQRPQRLSLCTLFDSPSPLPRLPPTCLVPPIPHQLLESPQSVHTAFYGSCAYSARQSYFEGGRFYVEAGRAYALDRSNPLTVAWLYL